MLVLRRNIQRTMALLCINHLTCHYCVTFLCRTAVSPCASTTAQ